MLGEVIVSWIGGISFMVWLPFTVYWNVVHLVCHCRCRKKRHNKSINRYRCNSESCRWSRFCSYWEKTCTPEEIENLYKLIEDYKKKNNLTN